jgi:mono/diheme cytochrome c family protein
VRFALALCGVATITVACEGENFPSPPAEILETEEAIRAGERLYEKNCSICHGAGGHGDGPQARSLNPSPADLRNLTGARGEPGYWFFRIKEGGKAEPLARDRSAMPGWGEHMSDREIWQVVAYMSAMIQGRT